MPRTGRHPARRVRLPPALRHVHLNAAGIDVGAGSHHVAIPPGGTPRAATSGNSGRSPWTSPRSRRGCAAAPGRSGCTLLCDHGPGDARQQFEFLRVAEARSARGLDQYARRKLRRVRV